MVLCISFCCFSAGWFAWAAVAQEGAAAHLVNARFTGAGKSLRGSRRRCGRKNCGCGNLGRSPRHAGCATHRTYGKTLFPIHRLPQPLMYGIGGFPRMPVRVEPSISLSPSPPIRKNWTRMRHLKSGHPTGILVAHGRTERRSAAAVRTPDRAAARHGQPHRVGQSGTTETAGISADYLKS